MTKDLRGQVAELICNLGRGGRCTWTMSRSAYLPLDEILISSPSNSTMAKENKKNINTHMYIISSKKRPTEHQWKPVKFINKEILHKQDQRLQNRAQIRFSTIGREVSCTSCKYYWQVHKFLLTYHQILLVPPPRWWLTLADRRPAGEERNNVTIFDTFKKN